MPDTHGPLLQYHPLFLCHVGTHDVSTRLNRMGQRFLDQYSLLHAAVGIVAYFWGFGFLSSLLIHTVFEWAENTTTGMKFINKLTMWPGGKPKADAFRNCVGDTVTFAIGWIAANALDAYGIQQGWY